jgi:hypothetical protein
LFSSIVWLSRRLDGNSRQACFRHGGERAVLLVAHVDEINASIPTHGIDDRVEGVADDAVAALHAGADQHFPESIAHSLSHLNYLRGP